MRIISGSLRRRTLTVPRGVDVRPTTDRVREAVFNWLQSRVDFTEVDVLDLFAGTGALGFEALSRGADTVTFVERSGRAADAIRANAGIFDMANRCRVHTAEALAWCGRFPGRFDLILADPPYHYEEADALVEAAMALLSPGGILVYEHARKGASIEHPALVDERTYGRTVVSYLSRAESNEAEPEKP